MKEFLNTAFLQPFAAIGTRILDFLPDVLAAIGILGIGWLLAWGLSRGVERGLTLLGIDHLTNRLGINAAMTRAGLKPGPCHLAGRALFGGSWSLPSLPH